MNQEAIITLDIIDSKKMNPSDLDRFSILGKELSRLSIIEKLEIFNGDGMQTKANKALDGLRTMVAQYCYFKFNRIPVRQALGVGEITLHAERLLKSAGPAFEISNNSLNKLKAKDELSSIEFAFKELNPEWILHSSFLSDIMHNWSRAQAEAIYFSLIGNTQMEIADNLRISQAAIHQRLKAAKFQLLKLLLNRYEASF